MTALTERLQQEYVEMYGGPDSTPVDPTEFAAPKGGFLVGSLEGVPVAMGGVRRHADDAVEISGCTSCRRREAGGCPG